MEIREDSQNKQSLLFHALVPPLDSNSADFIDRNNHGFQMPLIKFNSCFD